MDQNSTDNDLSKSSADIHNSAHEKGNQSRKNPRSAITVNIQLYIFLCERSEDPFENTPWRQIK